LVSAKSARDDRVTAGFRFKAIIVVTVIGGCVPRLFGATCISPRKSCNAS
jgi:hypothetical protein